MGRGWQARGICTDEAGWGQVLTFFYCTIGTDEYFPSFPLRDIEMNTELCKLALEKVGNPNVLVNLVSRRVRQLNSGGGVGSRPLVAEYATMGVADIALAELVDEKMDYELLSPPEEAAPTKRSKGKS
tara:strand:- start:36 stop:419 length:384 start_codon:yes stop_codon:yes gene_type:complete